MCVSERERVTSFYEVCVLEEGDVRIREALASGAEEESGRQAAG
jgi:hypothetical protein